MSFHGLTPEALVERSDSKNPATTCKGLTTSGRPCRRSLGTTPGSSPAPSPGNSPNKQVDHTSVLAILNGGDAAAFFCWQHKDQAENLVARITQQKIQKATHGKTRIMPLQKRSSIDTLAEKVGILDLDAETEQVERHRFRKQHVQRVKKRDTLPPEWQQIQGPLMSVPEEVVQETLPVSPRPPRRTTPRQERYSRSNVKASWSCCIRADDGYNDDGPPARRRERYEQRRSSNHARPQASQPSSHSGRPSVTQQMQERPYQQRQRYSQSAQSTAARQSQQQQQQLTPIRPPPRASVTQITSSATPHSQTQNFLSFIPPHLDPTTTSSLLAELSKPFAKDDEPGYIYIFWLTPTSEQSTPDDDIASTILDGDLDYQDLLDPSPSTSRSQPQNPTTARQRRTNQLSRYASIKPTKTNPLTTPKILLKIGRAQNIHRRLTQWTRQCNQNITLVRYYPHHGSAAAQLDSPAGAKVPHVNRVERLIHLELRGMGWGKGEKELCAECGRGHREWFEVPATRDGLRGVDRVVRRWVAWAEGIGESEGKRDDGRPIY